MYGSQCMVKCHQSTRSQIAMIAIPAAAAANVPAIAPAIRRELARVRMATATKRLRYRTFKA